VRASTTEAIGALDAIERVGSAEHFDPRRTFRTRAILDRKLVLLAFTAERRVFSKVWDGRAWDTPPGKWTPLGLLDEIDRPAPETARGMGSRQRARRPDRARRKE
jgi:hypothetical protein